MADLQTNLQRLENNSDEILSLVDDISDAIIAKGGTVPANTGLRGFANAINSIPSGGGGSTASRKDVNFYDYDGTIVNSYTAADFANLTELPANPSHTGLTAQGWNWSLADAKTYVSKYGKLNIGQMYITSDGKTRIYITLPEGRISPILQLYLNANSELDIDWGDGSTHSTFTSTTAGYKSERHNYSTAGDYVIAITVTTGSFALQSSASTSVSSILWNGSNSTNSPDRAYNTAIKKIEMGNGVTSIGNNAFNYCYSLQSITIPDGVTSIGQNAFRGCNSLSSITIPDGVISINGNTFQNCFSLSSITIPDGVTTISGSAFQNCYALQSITIPDGVTSISGSAFQSCYSLSSITIPDGVTSISGTAFSSCNSLSSITIPDGVTTIGQYAFQNCSSLQSITIPDSVTSIDVSAFALCYALSSVTIPNKVTGISSSVFNNCYSVSSVTIPDSVTSIDSGAFQNCYSLSSITIPDRVTSIGSSAFNSCSYMESIKFTSATPPTVSSSNTWTGVPTSCIIYVPTGTLETYKTATNYPNPSQYTYIEY